MNWFRSIWQAIAREQVAAGADPSADDGKQRISATGIALVTHFEGFYPRAYKCPAGVWTIGWGHTGLAHRDGTVHPGREITREEGEELLRYDMQVFEEVVRSAVKVPLAQHEFDALVAFSFNVGPGSFHSSTLLRKLNAGDKDGAAKEFAKWTKAKGKVLKGLVRRRNAEATLFRGGDWEAWAV